MWTVMVSPLCPPAEFPIDTLCGGFHLALSRGSHLKNFPDALCSHHEPDDAHKEGKSPSLANLTLIKRALRLTRKDNPSPRPNETRREMAPDTSKRRRETDGREKEKGGERRDILGSEASSGGHSWQSEASSRHGGACALPPCNHSTYFCCLVHTGDFDIVSFLSI